MLFTRCLLVQLVILGSFAASTVRPIIFTTPDLTELEEPVDSISIDDFSTELIETTTAQQRNVTSTQPATPSALEDDHTEATVAGEPITTSVASTESAATQSLTTVASSTLTTKKNLIVTVGATASSAHLIASFATLLLCIL